jgi:hypothetical protein
LDAIVQSLCTQAQLGEFIVSPLPSGVKRDSLNIWTQRVKLEAKPIPSDTGTPMGSGPFRYNVTKTGYCEYMGPVSRFFLFFFSQSLILLASSSILTSPHQFFFFFFQIVWVPFLLPQVSHPHPMPLSAHTLALWRLKTYSKAICLRANTPK